MCGFAGEFLLSHGRVDMDLLRGLAARLAHRGPDDDGSYLSPDGRYGVAFRRLAVIDIAGSHQPMSLPDGSVTIAFNGEIYNFAQLRSQLQSQGATFRTHGDTEVLLHLYSRYQLNMFERLDGMFAMAIYDSTRGRLVLARDRLGEKPLWYAQLSDRVVFASEAKALLAHPMVDRQWDPQAVIDYVTLGYIHAPGSIWRQVRKLPPANYLAVDDRQPGPITYWRPLPAPPPKSLPDAIDVVRKAVSASVESRLISDVPLGALLSGGIDSAIVVALMAKAAGKAGGVRTFTAGFGQGLYDERPAAARVADHCGTLHTELEIHPRPAEMLDRIVDMYDEPFADSSAIPTYLICQAAREHVKVALTGDGGDEAFGGYDRYRALHLADTMKPPTFLAVRIAGFLANIFGGTEERSKLNRLARFANGVTQPPAVQYLTYRSLFQSSDFPRLFTEDFTSGVNTEYTSEWFCDLFEDGEFDDEVARAQHHDLLTYLSDDVLTKSDIASMSSSLELRAPMLNHNVVSIGLGLPVDMKIQGRRGKWILRQAFADLLPPEVFAGPKRGFAVPLGDWLQNDLREEMQQTLLDRRFIDMGVFKATALAGLINDHVSGKADHRHRLWALMVFARWADKNGLL